MKTITLETLIESAGHIPAALIRAVVDQIGSWEDFSERAPDVAGHGADGGFHGFFYHSDTVPFAAMHMEDIRTLANQQAMDTGCGVLQFIASFQCLRGEFDDEANLDDVGRIIYGRWTVAEMLEKDPAIPNALAWYALEEVSRAFVDALENAQEADAMVDFMKQA